MPPADVSEVEEYQGKYGWKPHRSSMQAHPLRQARHQMIVPPLQLPLSYSHMDEDRGHIFSYGMQPAQAPHLPANCFPSQIRHRILPPPWHQAVTCSHHRRHPAMIRCIAHRHQPKDLQELHAYLYQEEGFRRSSAGQRTLQQSLSLPHGSLPYICIHPHI